MDRAEGRAWLGRLGVGREARDTEIGDHRPSVRGEQDVAGLHVAVDDPAEVRHTERPGDVEPDAHRLHRSEPTAALEPRREVLAVDEVHHEVWLVLVSTRVEAGHDVRVPQDRRRERLAPESVGEVGVTADVGTEQLHGDRTFESKVHRLVDRRHAAPADDPAELVAVADDPRFAWIGHGRTIAESASVGFGLVSSPDTCRDRGDPPDRDHRRVPGGRLLQRDDPRVEPRVADDRRLADPRRGDADRLAAGAADRGPDGG